MKNKYRIVSDEYLGYEAQVRFWWFPFFWFQMHERGFIVNSFPSIEEAESFIKTKRGLVVKDLG